MKRDYLFVHLLWPMLALTLIPTFLMMLLLNEVYDSYQYRFVLQESENTARQIALSIDDVLAGYNTTVQSLAANEELKQMLLTSGSQRAVQEAIADKMLRMKGRIEIHVISYINREYRCSSGTIPHLYNYYVHRLWKGSIFSELEAALPNQTIIRPTRYTNASSDSIALSIAQNIIADGQPVGCVILDLYRNELSRIVSAYLTGETQQIVLYFGDQYILLDSLNLYREGLVDPSASLPVMIPNRVLSDQNSQLTTAYYRKHGSQITVFNGYRTTAQLKSRQTAKYLSLLMMGVMIPLCLLVAIQVARRQTSPFKQMRLAMERAAMGDWTVRLQLNRQDEMKALENGFNNMVSQLERYTEDRIRQERLIKEAQLRSLQAQINPHFFLNTLASIRALARKNSVPEIQQIVDDLSALFTCHVYNANQTIPLMEDLKLIRSYIAIQNIRFGNKFSLEQQIPRPLENVPVPPLVLQTIVENSVIHGLENKIGPGVILICAQRQEGDWVHLSIQDNGVGMTAQQLFLLNDDTLDGEAHHIGLSNAKQRLRLHFGEEARLWVESQIGIGTTVHILVKATPEDE